MTVKKLLEPFDLRGKYMIADKGYDSDRFVHWLEERGAIVVIPSRKTAKYPRDIDRHIYMERHLVENLFLIFKADRRFAARYERRACLFSAVTLLAAIPDFQIVDQYVFVTGYAAALTGGKGFGHGRFFSACCPAPSI